MKMAPADLQGPFPVVFGFGNPLLDIQLQTDYEFLKIYKLEYGGYTFQGEDQEGIYEDMKSRSNVTYIAGGATLNSLRVCQGLSKTQGIGFYIGCVGNDDFADKMKELCEKEGLIVKFATSDSNPTGVCGVAIVDKERSLCTRLGAAQDLKLKHLTEQWSYLENAKVCYSAGFVLSVCVEGMHQIGEHCSQKNKVFATSLSAPFFVETFKDEMMSLMPCIDILFGNAVEFSCFAKTHGWGGDLSLEEIATRIVDLPKSNQLRGRTVVITQGSQPTTVATRWVQNGLIKIMKYPVIPLKKEEIVDTNAAGDAFVGGFLYGVVNGLEYKGPSKASESFELDLDLAVDYAHRAARHVVCRHGCSFDFFHS